MSSITTHISKTDEDEPRPSFHTTDALHEHFQKDAYLCDVQLLYNQEYYASIHDLICLNRMEISGMWNSVQNIEDHLEALEREVWEGFSMLTEDLVELKSLVRSMCFPCELHFVN
jgi:hypothetical protein